MKSFLLIISVLLGVYSCNSTKGDVSVYENDGMYTVSLDKVKASTAIIPLSSLVEDCILVHLESHEDAFFVSTVAYTTVTEEYIGVRTLTRDNYKLFDRSGKFLCTVGSRGRGPGEYFPSLDDVIIDGKNELIYLSCGTLNKIFVYTTSGQFLKEIVAPQGQRLVFPKLFLSDNILTVIHVPSIFTIPGYPEYKNSEAMMLQFDVNSGELLKRLTPPSEHFILRGNAFGGGDILTSQNIPEIFEFMPRYFAQNQYDTLYHVDMQNNKFLPFFTMDYDYNFTDGRKKPYFHQLNKSLIISLIIDEVFPNKPKIAKGFIATDLSFKTSSWVKVVNDYFGGIEALPYENLEYYFQRGYYVYNIQPEELMEIVENRLAENSCTEKDRQVLMKLLSSLNEGTNNVVFIGKLKDEIKTKLW